MSVVNLVSEDEEIYKSTSRVLTDILVDRNASSKDIQDGLYKPLVETIGLVDIRKDEVEEITPRLIAENHKLKMQILLLRDELSNHLSYKRLAKHSFGFIVFFASSYILKIMFDITIVTPIWSIIGLIFSFGFLLMAFAMSVDWNKQIN